MWKTISKLLNNAIIRTGAVVVLAVGSAALITEAQQNQPPLPGQPGADTTVAAVEARSAPYTVMGVGSNGVVTQKEVTPQTANALMRDAQPISSVMVLIHGNTAYIVHDIPLSGGQTLQTTMTKPISMQ
jgi:hypothetical protein